MNEVQARLILRHGLLSQAQIESVYRQLPQAPNHDLCSLLQSQGLLDPQSAQHIRAQSQGSQSQSSRLVHSKQSERMSAIAEPTPNTNELQSVRQLETVLHSNPWFKPHAEILWEKVEKLGEGGMGSIYRVRDKCLGRDAALKLMNSPSSENALKRFLKEAQMTSRLDHPAIPPVYEAGKTANGEHYMMMKVIEGETLTKKIHSQDNDKDELLNAVLRVSEAVAYAHSQGIIHRDLKPDNIMIGRFGEVLVLDWGIAKDLNRDDSTEADRIHKSVLSDEELNQAGMTVSGTMIGTPGYMAPEQIDGRSHKQSDVFALGLILTEVLTGTVSIGGDSSIERITATASGNSRTPREIDKSAPKELDFLARWAMELDLEDRLESAEGFVDNLKAYLAGKALPDYRYSLPERLTRWTAKHPGLLIGLAFAIVMVSTTATLYQAVIQSEREKNQAIVVADKAKDSEARVKEAVRKIRELEVMIDRGVPQKKILKGVEEALELGGDDYSLLLSAAKICRLAKLEKRALELLNKAAGDHPPAYEALFMRHQIELKDFGGDSFAYTEAAKEIVRRAEKRGDENEVSLTMKANGLYKKGEFKQALTALESLEKYSTSFAFGFLLRGVLKIGAGDDAGAKSDFNKAIESDGEYALAYYNRGIFRNNQGDVPGAIQDYDRAIRSDPRYAPAYANRGLIKANLGNKKEALADYNRAIEIDPKYPNSYFNRAGIKKDRGDYKGALADVIKGMKHAPRDAKNYFNRGYLRERVGDRAGALSDMTEAIAIQDNHFEAYTLRGLYKERSGDRAGAISDYNSALRINSKYADAYFYRGAWRQRVNDNARALSDFNLALKYDPIYADAYYSRGLIRANRGDRKGAVDDYSKAIKYKPNHVMAYNNRGIARYNMGDSRGSIEDYSQVIKLDPRHANAYFNRGGSKAMLGDLKGAVADFGVAVKLEPGYAKAYEMQGVVQKELKEFQKAALSYENYLRLNRRAASGAKYRAFILKHLGRPSRY